jgi:hypothetical protein
MDDLVKRLRVFAELDPDLAEALDRVEELEANIGALKAAFRVNMLRANASHEEIDAVIRAALGEKK